MPPERHSVKATALVSAARDLILAHGIRRVTVTEICGRAGVSKRTFYKHFLGRDDVAIRALGAVFDENAARIEAILCSDTPLDQKARAIIAAKRASAQQTSADVYVELMTSDSEPARYTRQRREEWERRIRAYYTDAQSRGEIRPDVDLDVLMYMLTKTAELAEDPELLAIQPDLGRLTESLMSLFFYGVLPRADASINTQGD